MFQFSSVLINNYSVYFVFQAMSFYILTDSCLLIVFAVCVRVCVCAVLFFFSEVSLKSGVDSGFVSSKDYIIRGNFFNEKNRK